MSFCIQFDERKEVAVEELVEYVLELSRNDAVTVSREVGDAECVDVSVSDQTGDAVMYPVPDCQAVPAVSDDTGVTDNTRVIDNTVKVEIADESPSIKDVMSFMAVYKNNAMNYSL